jgi:RHS repeat-associated protein
MYSNQYVYSANSFLAQLKEYQNGALSSDTRFVRSAYLSLQERSPANSITRDYAWGLNMGGGIGGLLNLQQNNQQYSYLYDGKGSVVALVDIAQTAVASYVYDTFGNPMAKGGTLSQPIQFSTKPYDERTGLSYFGSRQYSAGLGRWATRDPLAEGGGINLYAFSKNNPMSFVDPYGLSWGTTETGYLISGLGIGTDLSQGSYGKAAFGFANTIAGAVGLALVDVGRVVIGRTLAHLSAGVGFVSDLLTINNYINLSLAPVQKLIPV